MASEATVEKRVAYAVPANSKLAAAPNDRAIDMLRDWMALRSRQPQVILGHAWYKMLGLAELILVCTWALRALPAATDIVEADTIDPAAPSARIAGMMIARPMRMIPPGDSRSQQPVVRPACAVYLRHAESFPAAEYFMRQYNHFLNSEIAAASL